MSQFLQSRVLLVIVLNVLLFSTATLTPKSSKTKENKNKPETLVIGPLSSTVFERNLVVEKVTAKDIIKNNQGYYNETGKYNFKGVVLGYVTPWNNHGYDIAKIFGNKFTHISPVWLQLKCKENGKYDVAGVHDVDETWMGDVVAAGLERNVKIVPRVLFDGWSGDDYVYLFSNPTALREIAKTLIKVSLKWSFEGYVIEVWSQLAAAVPHAALIKLIKGLGASLKDSGLEMILVVPPKRDDSDILFTHDDFEQLYDHVTAFSLMTYDYSSTQRPGTNAPIKWVEECITYLSPTSEKRSKILTGLNFYGNAYTPNGGGPIISTDYLDLLQKFNGKLQYDKGAAESFFQFKGPETSYTVFYPTLYSINERLKLATSLGTGISIWELGQGLDYFYDLL